MLTFDDVSKASKQSEKKSSLLPSILSPLSARLHRFSSQRVQRVPESQGTENADDSHFDSVDSAQQCHERAFETKDPEKVLRRFRQYCVQKYGHNNIPKIVSHHTRSPYPGIARLTFTPTLLPGLKVKRTRLTRISHQAHSLGVKPGWILLSINKHDIICNRNQNVQERLNTAVKIAEPCVITFFTDPSFWKHVDFWRQETLCPQSQQLPSAEVSQEPQSPCTPPGPVPRSRSSARRHVGHAPSPKLPPACKSAKEASLQEAGGNLAGFRNKEPPRTSDPEKILCWYETFKKNSQCALTDAELNKFRPPFTELVRVEFFESIPHGLKLNGREVVNVCKQAAVHEVRPGWMILSICLWSQGWSQGRMILSPTCDDVEAQLSNAMMSNLPYTICFFKDPPLWKHINAAIKFAREFQHQNDRREVLQAMECTSIRLKLPATRSNSGALEEAIADVLKAYEVNKRDVKVQRTSTKTFCTIDLRLIGDFSVMAVQDKLDEATKDGTLAKSIRSVEVGAVTDKDIEIATKWPLERIQAIVHADYEYMLPITQLRELVQALSASQDVYKSAWELTQSSEPDAVAALAEIESMSCFLEQSGCYLMPNLAGRARGLKTDWVAQETNNLPDLLVDAEQAQLLLKIKLCPIHQWGEMQMNCTTKIPLTDSRRIWVSGVRNLAPSAMHFDPGIKSRERVLEKAQSRQTALDDEPPVKDLVDVSRIGIVFDSVALLLHTLQQILSKLDVVWVDNKFRNPSIVGYRDINIGVRQQLWQKGRDPKHISEVQLLHRGLYDIKMGQGHKHYETIRSLLGKFGVQREHEFAVQKTILRELETTAGKAAQEELHDAEKLHVFIAEHLPEESTVLFGAVEDAVKNSKDLLYEHHADEAAKIKKAEKEDLTAIKEAAKAWCNLGTEGGGTVNGPNYREKDCFVKALKLDPGYAMALNGAKYTEKECYLKVLELDAGNALAWNNLGVQGGDTVKGADYTEKECYLKALESNSDLALAWNNLGNQGGGTVNGANYSIQNCYLKALKLDPGYALAWFNLGTVGGGMVKYTDYTEKDCYRKTLELDPEHAKAWEKFGAAGGGTVKGAEYTEKKCYLKALEFDPGLALAWNNLGEQGGDTVNCANYTEKECYLKALELNPDLTFAWNNLGNQEGGTLNGTNYTTEDCYLKALELDPGYAMAWNNLGFHGGGTVKGTEYTEKKCYLKALELNPRLALAWNNLGNQEGGNVNREYCTRKDCYLKALESDPSLAKAWENLGVEGGGTVEETDITEKECYVQALELNPGLALAWTKLGNQRGGIVKGRDYTNKECYLKAVQSDPDLAEAWEKLAEQGGGTVQGAQFTHKECYLKSLELSPDNAKIWIRVGVVGGGTIKGTNYSKVGCYIKALGLDSGLAYAWSYLGAEGGGSVMGVNYTAKACLAKAVYLDPSFAVKGE